MLKTHQDASHLYEVERRDTHAERDGFRINELQISTSQTVPWHYHTHIKDTFYVLDGEITVYLRDPKEAISMAAGETYAVEPKRPHLVTNSGSHSATFLVLQGVGEYDYVQLA
jgi:quercetin dioxygenase-like cupin family protein